MIEKGVPIKDYCYSIYIEWDKRNIPCPHNPNGWVAYWRIKYGVSANVAESSG